MCFFRLTYCIRLELKRQQPWSAYAVHLTTLSPPAFVGDLMLVYLCHKSTESCDLNSRLVLLLTFGSWMLLSKFIKLLGHYIRYPIDFLLLPLSILFGYFHGFIKLYAMFTLNVVSETPLRGPI